jgi:hypothetical protein
MGGGPRCGRSGPREVAALRRAPPACPEPRRRVALICKQRTRQRHALTHHQTDQARRSLRPTRSRQVGRGTGCARDRGGRCRGGASGESKARCGRPSDHPRARVRHVPERLIHSEPLRACVASHGVATRGAVRTRVWACPLGLALYGYLRGRVARNPDLLAW